MRRTVFFADYLSAILDKDAETMRSFFAPGAVILWHNSNECFTPEELADVNAAYPSGWSGEIEHELRLGEDDNELIIGACRVWSPETGASFHAVMFIQVHRGLIVHVDEYWGDDQPPPEWRQRMNVGTRIS